VRKDIASPFWRFTDSNFYIDQEKNSTVPSFPLTVFALQHSLQLSDITKKNSMSMQKGQEYILKTLGQLIPKTASFFVGRLFKNHRASTQSTMEETICETLIERPSSVGEKRMLSSGSSYSSLPEKRQLSAAAFNNIHPSKIHAAERGEKRSAKELLPAPQEEKRKFNWNVAKRVFDLDVKTNS
jgi:hypothetical protein